MQKKLFSMVLIAAVAASMLAGCHKTKNPGGKSAVSAGAVDKTVLPISKEPITITMWRPNDAKVTASMKGFGDMKLFQELEKRTNIKVEFKHPPLNQQADQFNLMMATNDLPDVIYYNWGLAPSGPSKYYGDNQIIKLNDYIDKDAPNFKKLLSAYRDFKKQASMDDGSIVMFPLTKLDKTLNVVSGFQVRRDWLNKVALPAPESIDDWYQVLTAFKAKDPNGNGKSDEIPFTGNAIDAVATFSAAFGVLNNFMMKEGKVVYGPVQPEFKTFLAAMAKWYKEGLIDPDIAIANATALDYKMTNNIAGSYNGPIMSGMGRYTNTMRSKQPDFELTGVVWPTNGNGKNYTSYGLGTQAMTYGAAITSKAKNVKEIVQYLDYAYSEEGSLLYNYGIDGESYTMKNGVPTFTDKILKNPNGLTSDQALAQYAISILDGPYIQERGYFEQMLALPEQKKAVFDIWSKGDDSLCLPSALSFTSEESKQYSVIMNQVNTYVTEMITRIVMGKQPVSDFDNAVKDIERMGIVNAVRIQQAALERYNKR